MPKKVPRVVENIIPEPDMEMLAEGTEMLLKWAPLICAGIALGVSVLALNELRSMKEDVVSIKKEKTDLTDIHKKMDTTDAQMKKMNEYLSKRDKNPVIKSMVPPEIPDNVNVINQEEEYEEVEVTDNEEDDN